MVVEKRGLESDISFMIKLLANLPLGRLPEPNRARV